MRHGLGRSEVHRNCVRGIGVDNNEIVNVVRLLSECQTRVAKHNRNRLGAQDDKKVKWSGSRAMSMIVGSISKKRQVSFDAIRHASDPEPSPMTAVRNGPPLRARTASMTRFMADLSW